MKSQNERLLSYLKQHKRINPLEAWARLGIYRLGARVYDLKRRGERIVTGTVTVSNQYGEKCRVAQYEYIGEVM